jgi:LysM repeat protein
MSTYTVKRGDSLSKIYKSLGYKTWQDLYNANKKAIGSNPNLIYAGTKLNYAGSGGSSGYSSSTNPTSVPSAGIGTTIAATVEDPTRENFIRKYGNEQDTRDEAGNIIQGLRPDEMIQAVSEENVNPEQFRIASQYIKDLDWQRAISGSGGRVSGSTLWARQNALNKLERQRKEAVNQYTQTQNDLFSNWYNQEMEYYMKSKAPSAYQLNKFGIDTPWADNFSGDMSLRRAYEYKPALDITKSFNLGGYSRPATMYNMPTPLS